MQALSRPPRPQIGFHGGLVLGDSDGKLRHRQKNAPFDCHSGDALYPDRIDGEFNYGGLIRYHFGHFMSESVHRIVPSILLNGKTPFLFVTIASSSRVPGQRITSFDTLPSFARQAFQLLGTGEREFRLISDNTVVDHLFVAEQGSELGLGPKPGYLEDLHEYVTPRLDALHGGDLRAEKVYVSRSRMIAGNFLGERYLEEQLAAEGFVIAHPEALPLSVQMDMYRKSRLVVFSGGSACHGVELLGAESLRQCYILSRNHINESLARALRPRAAEFAISEGHPYVGSRFLKPKTGRPATRLGVTVFDVEALLAFFRGHAIARLAGFNERDYFEAAERDLRRYHRWNALDGGLADRFHSLFTRRSRASSSSARHDVDEAFRMHVARQLPRTVPAKTPDYRPT